MSFNKILEEISYRRDKEQRGILFPHLKASNYIPTIEQSTYYLIGGDTGSGKTTFADDVFLYHPYETYDKVHFIYFSFEVTQTAKIVKGIARNLFKKYGIVTDVNFILSRGKNRIDTKIYELACREADYFDGLFDKLTMIDVSENPTGISKLIIEVAKKYGTYTSEDIVIGENSYKKSHYTPHDKDQYIIVFLDHVALAKREKGYNTKENIDKISEYLIPLRNLFGVTPVVIQQYSRGIQSTDRNKLDMIRPQLSDFKDSANTQQDANVVFGLFHPFNYGITNQRGYNITDIGNRVRWNYVLKNRDGESGFNYGLSFMGECGVFEELPYLNIDPNKNKFTQDYINQLKSYRRYVSTETS